MPAACPPTGTFAAAAGDANGDGAADLADAVYLRRAVTTGGAAQPWCADAVDIVVDDLLLLDDVNSLLYHLYEGAFDLPNKSTFACDGQGTAPEAPCAAVAFGVRQGEDPSTAYVRLVAPTLSVQGWSVAVDADGCSITAATTDGTAGAMTSASPPGARDSGYDATFVLDGDATSAVLLGLVRDATVSTGPAGVDVLALTLAKGEGCTCSLSIDQALSGLGKPVAPLVVADAAAYRPAPTEVSFDLCAGAAR